MLGRSDRLLNSEIFARKVLLLLLLSMALERNTPRVFFAALLVALNQRLKEVHRSAKLPPPPGRETPSAPKQGDSVPKLLQLLGTTVTLLSLSLPVRAKMSLCFSNNFAFEGRSIALLVQRELVTLKNES